MINVTVCGESKQIEDNTVIAELLTLENVDMPQYVSVSVNDEFVKKDNYRQHRLNDGDTVEFLYFMGGGR